MTECPECREALQVTARCCTRCGAAAPPAPAGDPLVGQTVSGAGPPVAPRSRRPFWFFVAAMAVALAGGGTIVLLARKTAQERQGGFRARAERAGAVTTPAPTSAPTPTSTPASLR